MGLVVCLRQGLVVVGSNEIPQSRHFLPLAAFLAASVGHMPDALVFVQVCQGCSRR